MVTQTETRLPEHEDLTTVLNLIMVSAVQILEGSAGAIALWETRIQRFLPQASYGLESIDVQLLHPRLDRTILSILGRAGENLPLVLIPSDLRWPGRHRLEHILALPLTQEQELVGVIYVFRPASARQFQVRDVHLLEIFAQQAAAAIQSSRLVKEASQERQRLLAMQESFVGIVSHELQTPIAIIKGYASTLLNPEGAWRPEVVQRVATTIEDECDRLQGLVTDLLDISRIQAGRVAMAFSLVDIGELVGDAVQAMRVKSPERRIDLVVAPNLPRVRADADKLRRAVQNLVDNAIKYSPTESVITIRAQRTQQELCIAVHDQGVGVPEGEREHIFDRFHRVDTSLSRTTPGVGLGLYIVKAIIDAHGGRTWVESPGPGKGSTFIIALPMDTEA
ncbi:MAG TPA: ATP-binding protein [Chloroflexota bacterium]|jgi:signal transduction histidine kinase|nr:ATP-binding protein [Chloroflexota bacterium]